MQFDGETDVRTTEGIEITQHRRYLRHCEEFTSLCSNKLRIHHGKALASS